VTTGFIRPLYLEHLSGYASAHFDPSVNEEQLSGLVAWLREMLPECVVNFWMDERLKHLVLNIRNEDTDELRIEQHKRIIELVNPLCSTTCEVSGQVDRIEHVNYGTIITLEAGQTGHPQPHLPDLVALENYPGVQHVMAEERTDNVVRVHFSLTPQMCIAGTEAIRAAVINAAVDAGMYPLNGTKFTIRNPGATKDLLPQFRNHRQSVYFLAVQARRRTEQQ